MCFNHCVVSCEFLEHCPCCCSSFRLFAALGLGSRVFVQLIMNFLDVKRLSLGNSTLFYCVSSRVVTTLSRSGFTQTKALCIKLSVFVSKLVLAWQNFPFAACWVL